MEFIADIVIMPLPALLDPKGKATELGLKQLGFESISEVRIGKHIRLRLEAPDHATADKISHEACQKLLVNPVMETYHLALQALVPTT